MATQYTAGLTTQVLTSAIMNSIGATWETWTPTVTASAGTITSATVTLARYARIQNIVWVTFGYSVSNVGTAAGASLVTTLPITPSTSIINGTPLGSGREYVSVGFALIPLKTSATQITIQDYTGAGWLQNNRGATLSLCYEAA